MGKQTMWGLVLAASLVMGSGVAADAPANSDPVWGPYAALAGRSAHAATGGYQLRWYWAEPGRELVQEWLNPQTGTVAHRDSITPGASAGTLVLQSSAMGKKQWLGALQPDGTVLFIGKGLFKLPYLAGTGQDGTWQVRSVELAGGRIASVDESTQYTRFTFDDAKPKVDATPAPAAASAAHTTPAPPAAPARQTAAQPHSLEATFARECIDGGAKQGEACAVLAAALREKNAGTGTSAPSPTEAAPAGTATAAQGTGPEVGRAPHSAVQVASGPGQAANSVPMAPPEAPRSASGSPASNPPAQLAPGVEGAVDGKAAKSSPARRGDLISVDVGGRLTYATSSIPPAVLGTYLYEREGQPVIVLGADNRGQFQAHGVAAIPIRYWLETDAKGAPFKQMGDGNPNYLHILVVQYGPGGGGNYPEGSYDRWQWIHNVQGGCAIILGERFKCD